MARKFKTDAQKDAELGISRGRTDSAASRGTESGTITAVQKERPYEVERALEGYDPSKVVDPAKAAIAAETTKLKTSVDEAITKAADDLDAIIAEAEAGILEAERLVAEAERFAAEGEAAEAAGDQVIIDAYKSGQFSYPDLPKFGKDLINELPEYKTVSDAGLAAAVAALSAVGVEGLVEVMAEIRRLYPDISSADALNLLKFDKRFNNGYLMRFSGNKKLQDAGFAMLDDKTYLATEKAYNKIFNAYGLKQYANRERYGNLIGSSISADELTGRISTAYDRIVKGASETKIALNRLFPELNDGDILAYAIDPVNQLPAIQRKIQAAEIGGAALVQNLSIGLDSAPTEATGIQGVTRQGLSVEQLLNQGVDLQTARTGFSRVAESLPVAEKLSGLYNTQAGQVGRMQLEEEQFKGLASAKRARQKIIGLEEAQFEKRGGVGKLTKDTRAAY
jgi:hypothetical protein